MPESADIRRRRARFRAWHRGIREMDLLMGGFADARIDALDESELADFETLLELQDRDVLAWLTTEVPAPADIDTPVFRQIRQFHTHAGPRFD